MTTRHTPSPGPRRRFDDRYYRTFYHDPATRVADARSTGILADFILAYMAHLGLPAKNVLDLGCGIGLWKKALKARRPSARYTGVENSDYLCKKYGWESGDVREYAPTRKYDLVICQSVLQYLSNADAARALANLSRICGSILYLEVVTRRDLARNCDLERTDCRIVPRSGAWYKKRLIRYFRPCGGGIFLARKTPVSLYELECI